MTSRAENPQLRRYIASVGDLPTIPSMANELLALVEKADTSADDLRRLIERDPSLAARILKVANSSLYGFSRRIETLRHAIALLGFRTVGNVVLAASLREVFRNFGLTEKLLWEHATLAGAVASRLCLYGPIRVVRDEAFTAGLLHDLGKIALNNTSRQRYTEIFARVYNEGVSFVEAEREAFGFDHAELGASVAAKWKLPSRLERAIRYHHSPEVLAQLPEEDRRLTALTTVTTACCTRLGVGRRAPVESLDLAALPAWQSLELDEDDVEPVLDLATKEVKRSEGLIG